MEKFDLIATSAFGLEGIVSRELDWLEAEDKRAENGRVRFRGGPEMIAKANLWLRTSDRVLIVLAEGDVKTFEELFCLVKSVPFEDFMPSDARFPVTGKSVNSVLHSVPDCQSITKKAAVERMKSAYGIEWFKEDGPLYKLEISILNDHAILTLDTSGAGLHKRGYRRDANKAPIKETLAAGMILTSRFKKDRVLIDPFCGSGTIPIEAAMIARNIAPGLKRNFDFEEWPFIGKNILSDAQEEAISLIDEETELHISGSDIDYYAIKHAMENATFAGVRDDIHFQKLDFKEVRSHYKYGFIITNPPYGERLGDASEAKKLYKEMGAAFAQFDTWSEYIITSCEDFEKSYGRKADKKRKLYNGMLKCNLYQFFGPRPPKERKDINDEG